MDSPVRHVPLSRAWYFALAAALALSLLPAALASTLTAAHAQEPPADRSGLEHACPEGSVPDSGFTDIDGNTHEHAIECAAWWGITRGGPAGLPATQYGPTLEVPRDQMASFIARLVDAADGQALPAWDNTNRFDDVDDANVHVANINRLAQAGIVQGRTATEYFPKMVVRRDQMASFIARAIAYVSGLDRASDEDHFLDVDEDNPHRQNINGLFEEGVVQGRAPGVYEPAGHVRRDAMAAFVMRALDLHVEEGDATPPDEEPPSETPEETPEPSTTTQSVTDAPELLGVETVDVNATTATVAFTFDAAVDTDSVDPERFFLYGLDSTEDRFAATAAELDAEDATVVLATFAAADYEVANTAAVAHGAVADAEGLANPERGLGLKPVVQDEVAYVQGASFGPRLVSAAAEAAGPPGVFELTWVFDEDVELSAGDLAAYLENGTRLEQEGFGPAGSFGNCGIDGNVVTCFAIASSAPVLLAVGYDAVTQPQNGAQFPNYEQARAAATANE